MGAVTPLGNNVKIYWDNVLAGVSGVGPITRFEVDGLACKIAAQVKDFEPTDFLDRKEARRMDRFSQFAMVASDEAIRNAGIVAEQIDGTQVGVIVSSGIGGLGSLEREIAKAAEKGLSRLSPFLVPMMISDMAAGHISIKHGFKGPNYAISSACASSSHAVGEGYHNIVRGDAEIMVCGGSEASITPVGVGSFDALRALSTRNAEPETASRPFDLQRDGFVVGEGAGILILESLESALRRNATVIAEVAGVAYTADAYHVTAPAPGGEGACRAMALALRSAQVAPDEVQYINAHGTSTPANDKTETDAIAKVFGEHAHQLQISSTKSMIGHLLGAAGGVELIVTALACFHDVIPPTINLFTPDPACYLNYTPWEPVPREVHVALSNSFGFGGHNVTIVLKKYAA